MIDTTETNKTGLSSESLEHLGLSGVLADTRFPKERLQSAGFEDADSSTTGGYSQAQRNALRKIERALSYMLEHLDQTIPIPTLSALVGLSVSKFYYLFKAGTGYTPNDFHIRTRMSRACLLIRETDLSVKELARQLGYDDQFYFSRLFKSVVGVPPREYRTRIDENESSKARAVVLPDCQMDLDSRRPDFLDSSQKNQKNSFLLKVAIKPRPAGLSPKISPKE